jgi:hypothetical protein
VGGRVSRVSFRSQLVFDLPHRVLPPPDLALVLDALWEEFVHDAEDDTALLRLGSTLVGWRWRRRGGTLPRSRDNVHPDHPNGAQSASGPQLTLYRPQSLNLGEFCGFLTVVAFSYVAAVFARETVERP